MTICKIRSYIKTLQFLFLPVSFLMFSSCSNTVDPVESSFTVHGKITDNNGFPAGNITAFIGNSSYITKGDGTFTIPDVTSPYNLKLYRPFGIDYTCIEYQRLTTSAPLLSAPDFNIASGSSILILSLPPLKANQHVIAVFTDGDKYQAIENFVQDTTTIALTWGESASLTGRLIILEYTMNAFDEIISYDNFGYKDGIVFNNGSSTVVDFSTSDLSFNPGETNVSGIVTGTSSFYDLNSTMAISFNSNISDPAASEQHQLQTTYSIAAFNYVIPAGLPIPFKVIYRGFGNESSSYIQRYMEFPAGSSGNVINLQNGITLNAPQNSATGVDSTADFIYTPASGYGVHIVEISSYNNRYFIYTTSNTSKIPDFSLLGIRLSSSTLYYWDVIQLSGIQTTDDLVSVPLNFNQHHNGNKQSGQRTFTSRP
ncbi:hypothetical protein BH10BAC5_BH10BAC5_21820 [soil metagenome]